MVGGNVDDSKIKIQTIKQVGTIIFNVTLERAKFAVDALNDHGIVNQTVQQHMAVKRFILPYFICVSKTNCV